VISKAQKPCTGILNWDFYATPCEALAKRLLGKKLFRWMEDKGTVLTARIVEVEAYLGGEDRGE
jgi:3-methyladenine DNA glycosylase Mpg